MTFDDTTDLLAAQTYPLSAEELSTRVGDHELDYPNGTESLQAVIERTGEERFETAEDAQTAVYGALGSGAVGRVGYSDRDPDPMGVGGAEPVSF